LRSRRITHMRS